MRIDLETIKKIEYYLTNNMSVIERKLFEQEMADNKELREAVAEQKNLTIAMEKSNIKSLAVNAGIKYHRNQLIKYITGACTVVAILVGSYFVYEGLTGPKSVNNNAVVENIIPKNQSTQNGITPETIYTDSVSPGQEDFLPLNQPKFTRYRKDILVNDTNSFVARDLDTFKVKFSKFDHIDTQINNTIVKVDSVKNNVKLNVDNSKIFHHFTKESEFFTVSSKKDIKIKGLEGTKITIPKGTLVDSTGNQVTGSVTIQLMEFYKRSDIIFADLHTQSNGKLLESGGMIYISATQNNEELFVAPGKYISIQFAGKTLKDSMLLFNGVSQNDQFDWQLINPTQSDKFAKNKMRKHEVSSKIGNRVEGFEPYVYNSAYNTLILQTGQLKWINCDRFKDSYNNTSLTVKYSMGYIPDLRLVFSSINSMMNSYKITDTETVFDNIPIGMEVDIVAFAMVDNEPFYFIKRITITENHVEHIDLQKTTLEELELQIRKFDTPGKNNDIRLMN